MKITFPLYCLKAFKGFVFMVENTKGYNSGPWWKPAMQVFSEISTWIATPIILAVVFGKMLDNKYGTDNLWLLILAGLAFVVSSYGIVKSVKKYALKVKREEEQENK